jgi:hypothetical protein
MSLVVRSLAVLTSGALALGLSVSCSSDEKEKAESPDGGDGGSVRDGGDVIAEPCTPNESAAVAKRCSPDGSDPALPECGKWIKKEIPGAVCGDGSQYKFFVNYSNTSNNVVVAFEPGGACWDYESCSGAGGVRGAANPNGIKDNHMERYQYLNLLQKGEDAKNPVKDYNMVFVSYCTGDVHSGNNVITYERPPGVDAGDAPASLEFHHAGHDNVTGVIEWMNGEFKTVPKLLVTGCSAGGAGAIINYHFVRRGMKGAQCGYLLDDSGPIFHSDGPSNALHQKIRTSWNVDTVLDLYEGNFAASPAAMKADFGVMNEGLAKQYPHDRLALTLYRKDMNYSLYSYQRFFPNPSEEEITEFWWKDITELRKTYDAFPNLAYYIPNFRSDNCSHCVSIPPLDHLDYLTTNPWYGSEIQSQNVTLEDFTRNLLDDGEPMRDYVEAPIASEGFTAEESASCMEGG